MVRRRAEETIEQLPRAYGASRRPTPGLSPDLLRPRPPTSPLIGSPAQRVSGASAARDWLYSWSLIPPWGLPKPRAGWVCTSSGSANGGTAGPSRGSRWSMRRVRVDPRPFPSRLSVAITAIACELPAARGLPWRGFRSPRSSVCCTPKAGSRSLAWPRSGAAWMGTHCGPGSTAPGSSRATPPSGRKPAWCSTSTRASGRGTPGPRDYVICADEKTSIQARRRRHLTLPPGPALPQYVEHEYRSRWRGHLPGWPGR